LLSAASVDFGQEAIGPGLASPEYGQLVGVPFLGCSFPEDLLGLGVADVGVFSRTAHASDHRLGAFVFAVLFG
jgi:hypothetical protein